MRARASGFGWHGQGGPLVPLGPERPKRGFALPPHQAYRRSAKGKGQSQGGDRLAQTRLRVTLRTATGSTLYVRDGQIKVSIARIKSGALPGLKGIL